MLSARGEEYDKINGFNLGIDDYVVNPFSPRELMLRVDAVMKRVKSSAINTYETAHHDVIQIDNGGLKVDITARMIFIDDKSIEMSPKEYELLFYMILNRNIALSREKLICEVWGYDFYGDARTLDTHIKLLRKSLGRYSSLIVTLRGIGYRLDAKIDSNLTQKS
jgi:DNA-binding response OmpR family regulator